MTLIEETMTQTFGTAIKGHSISTSLGFLGHVYHNCNVSLLAALLVPAALGGCDSSDSSSTSLGVIVVSAPLPPAAAPPAAAPTAAAPAEPQALLCNVADAVKRADKLAITPVAGNVAIVTIGSSSTAGYYASSYLANYPSVLQSILQQTGGVVTYQVYNKGLNGDTISGTESRIDIDAVSLHPQLIILQVGTNDAISGPNEADRNAFSTRLTSLVARLKLVSAVVLMNGQYYPTQPANYEDYQNSIGQVSIDQGVPMIDRYELMKSWIMTKKYSFNDILAIDQFHPNDFTYRCMGQIAANLTVMATKIP
ncbi:MAG: SGNH/GDSL hydrolase family protein [Hymenobacter sp.]|nr:MAG: SGNH/GDSL hydrolase family protein [Hymenobacter sp.]